jgi:hypothetical protein
LWAPADWGTLKQSPFLPQGIYDFPVPLILWLQPPAVLIVELEAEGVGFEPTPRKNRGAVFKTATISHSVTPPETKFQFLFKTMAALDGKLALFFYTIHRGGKTSTGNAVASDCIHSIIWLQTSIVKAIVEPPELQR